MEFTYCFYEYQDEYFPYKNLHLLWHISCQIQLKDFFGEGFKCRRVNRDTWNS